MIDKINIFAISDQKTNNWQNHLFYPRIEFQYLDEKQYILISGVNIHKLLPSLVIIQQL